jgi:hypothetical protein
VGQWRLRARSKFHVVVQAYAPGWSSWLSSVKNQQPATWYFPNSFRASHHRIVASIVASKKKTILQRGNLLSWLGWFEKFENLNSEPK